MFGAKEILEEALTRGGEVLMEYWGRPLNIAQKESISSVLTEADLAAEKAILEILDRFEKSCNVITEERGFMDRGSAYTWVVDPLDGTSNFAAGLPWFGVIIALMKERLPILGGMFLPVEKLLYLTERGKGSSRNGEAIQVTLSSRLENQLVAYSFDFHEDPAHTQSEMEIMARLSRRVRNIRSTNSLVDFCYVADGRLGAALNQCTKIWDIAVPWLMITEAGGRVSDIHGKEIRFRPKQRDIGQNYTIMASGKSLHPQILELVKAKN